MNSGETGAVVATPNENFSQNVVKITKKRKQAEKTDFFANRPSRLTWSLKKCQFL